MVTLSIAVILCCLAVAVRFALATRGLGNRYRNVAAFVPGATLAQAAVTKKRRKIRITNSAAAEIDRELPDLVELMSVVLHSGQSLQVALELIAERGIGKFATRVRQMQTRLQLAATLDSELQAICADLPTAGIREFANKVSIAVNRGTPLAASLASLAFTLRQRVANDLLRKAGANETKMLIPLVTMVLPVTVIFALYPSTAVLQLGL